MRRDAEQVALRRRNDAIGPSGIYRCDIPTDAIHDDSDLSVGETVYVGLYASGGNELMFNTWIRVSRGRVGDLLRPPGEKCMLSTAVSVLSPV